MKRITKIMVAAAAVVLALAGCKRGEQVSPLNTIYATMASHSGVNPSGGKSQIDGNDVCWSKGDKIALITTGDEKIEYTLSSGSGTTSGEFSGGNPSATTGPYCVVYPYGSVNSCSYDDSGFTVKYSLPQKQNYSKNSFGEGANLSIGYSNDYNFKFLNMMGVLKVTINNAATCFVEKVELVSKNTSDVLWGDGNVTINGPTAECLSFGTRTGGDHILTLGEYMKGEYMKWEKGDVSLYFVVPAGTLQSGFEIKIYEYGYANPITEYEPGKAIEFTNPNGQNVIQRSMVSVLDFGDRLIPTKGYVDLGEAAGKWAQCNYGADKPYEPGWYCQYAGRVDVTGKNRLDLRRACPYFNTSAPTWTYTTAKDWQKALTKYTGTGTGGDGLTYLVEADCSLGSGWRIPTRVEVEALYKKTNRTWLDENGEYGRAGCKLTSKTNGNYIFLPACGYWGHVDSGDSQILTPENVYVGSGTVCYHFFSFRVMRIKSVTMDESFPDDIFYRYFGVPFRPIYDGK